MYYETKAGTFSEADTYTKILDLLDQLRDQYNIMGHNKKMQGHDLVGQGFIAIGEMIKVVRVQTTNLATGKMRSQAGYR